MKKFKGWFIALVIIILVIVVLWIIKTPLTASYLSNKLKTDVSISNMSVSSNLIQIKNFRLKNPRRSKNRYAFVAQSIEIRYSFSKLFNSPSLIDSILVKDVNLNIECANPLCTKNNWTTLVGNISDKEKRSASKKEYIIKELELNNMDVEILGMGLDFTRKKQSHIASIKFYNINSKTGFPTQQLIAAIFRSAGL